MQKLLTFSQQKLSVYLPYFQDRNFNVTLANNLVKLLNNWALIVDVCGQGPCCLLMKNVCFFQVLILNFIFDLCCQITKNIP